MLEKILLGTACAAVLGAGCLAASAQAEELTVVSFGGSYQDAQSKALFQPAAKALGITVKEETYTGIADLRLKVKAGAVTWDIVASGSGSAAHAGAEGILEKLDYKVIDVTNFVPHTYQDYCVGGDVFSTVLAWNTKTYGEKGPQSWADFWDVKKFPGKRSYRNAAAGSLEPALMADGVAPDKVYEVLSAARRHRARGQEDQGAEARHRGMVELGRAARTAHEGRRGRHGRPAGTGASMSPRRTAARSNTPSTRRCSTMIATPSPRARRTRIWR